MAGMMIMLIMRYTELARSTQSKASQNVKLGSELQSAAETFYTALENQEIEYYIKTSSCGVVRPFLSALKYGSGCDEKVSLFVSDHSNGLLYGYKKGCVIGKTGSNCVSNGREELLEIDPKIHRIDELSPFVKSSFKFSIVDIIASTKEIKVLAISEVKGEKKGNNKRFHEFTINNSMLNKAHLEQDGRVTEESPSHLNRCRGTPWGTLQFFNPTTQKCEEFSSLWGMDGLIFYKERYFGFQQSSGQVYDLLNAVLGREAIVEEKGSVGGKKLFPAYKKSELRNVNDLTTIDDTLFGVEGSGPSSKIIYFDSKNQKSVDVCDLAKMGWPVTFLGILASSRSHDISQMVERERAHFLVKAADGRLLNIIVQVKGREFRCYGVFDSTEQEIEYKRTYGFDRSFPTHPISI